MDHIAAGTGRNAATQTRPFRFKGKGEKGAAPVFHRRRFPAGKFEIKMTYPRFAHRVTARFP
jgi:hypothetical protein